MKASLYIHIPFCKSKCRYCDFESYAGRLDCAQEYVSRVIEEAKQMKEAYGAFGVPSVYIGGGTPSYLPEKELSRLLENVLSLFKIDTDCEISMEANPGTVSVQKLSTYKKAGVNRISFGAQAAQDALLKSLGRIHRWQDVEEAVKTAQDAGLENINIDLMYALPGQTEEDFAASVQKAVKLKVPHLSMYSLILEEGTPLFESVSKGETTVPDDDACVAMQERAIAQLAGTGISRYEISNYAKKGYECRHNLVYWTRENYLGLGCGAHSLMNEERFYNPPFEGYMKGVRREDAERISEEEQLEEAVMLETRLTRGLDLLKLERRFGRDRRKKLEAAAQTLVKGGFAKMEEERLFLTQTGLNLQNAMVLSLLDSL